MAKEKAIKQMILPLITFMIVIACKVSAPTRITPAPEIKITTLAADAPTLPTESTIAPADRFLAQCPNADEVAQIDTDLTLKFDADPTTSQPLACRIAEGSRDLTPLQKRTYNILLLMKQLRFTQPLPWTDKLLYKWMVDTIDGIRFRADIEHSFCCAPINMINIQTNDLIANTTDRWIEPASGLGLRDLLVLFVHETRHNEGKLHTCDGIKDNSLSEMGAWAVQYYLDLWLVDYTVDPTFFTAQDSDYLGITHQAAEEIRATRFCLEPPL